MFHVKQIVLETERLILRSFNERDLDYIFEIFSDVEVNKYLPWFPLKTKEDALLFYNENYVESKNKYSFAICLKENNIPIGYINVLTEDSYDFGYGLLKKYWNKGITSEACIKVIGFIKSLGIPFITATHDVNNIHSGNVMKKLGMKYKYSYEENWQPKNILVTFRMYQMNFKDENYVYLKYWDISNKKYIESI